MSLSKSVGFLAICIFTFSQLYSQPKPDTLTEKEASKLLKSANKYFASGDYNASMIEYQSIEKFYKNDPDYNYKFGVSLLHESFDRKKGIGHLFISANAGNTDAYRMIGWGCHLMYDFNEALKFYKLYTFKSDTNSTKYKNSGIKKMIEETYNAMELIQKPVAAEIVNLGSKVNSPWPDYVPVITADDQNIYFTSRRDNSTGGKTDHNKQFFEDVFHSVRDSSTGEWKQANHLHENINSHGHDAIAGMSADGHTLLIYRNDETTGFGDIFVSYLRGVDWTEPKKIGGGVNLPDSWEPSGSLTANEDALYFCSNRKGGFGGSDIYMAKRLPDGTWGDPVNLGDLINTPYDEDAPFIHPDGKSLYFSSKGHKNIGGFDVFKTTKDDSGKWIKPINMGHPINTTDDDIYFVMTANGLHGYYASMGADSRGEKDIYMITFPPEDKPLVILKGRVIDETEKSISAHILVNKTSTTKLFGLYNSNAASGKYMTVLYPGFVFRAIYAAEGYMSDTLYIDTREMNSFNEIVKNIKLRKKGAVAVASTNKPETIVVPKKSIIDSTVKSAIANANTLLVNPEGKTEEIKPDRISKSAKDSIGSGPIPMTTTKTPKNTKPKPLQVKDCLLDTNNMVNSIALNFGYKIDTLTIQQKEVLDQFIAQSKGLVGVKINAHTDNKGSMAYNMLLSQRRAISIVKYLQNKGINGKKIFSCYYGKNRPLLPNENPDGSDNPDNRFKNRRAEIQFVVR